MMSSSLIPHPSILQFKALPPLALYVHIPWCAKKCPYCDFNSHEARGAVPEARYVAALIADLDRALPGLRAPAGIGPSCGLELLPRARARAKLENMVAIAREYAGRDGRSR